VSACGQAVGSRAASRFQDDRHARRATGGAPVAAFDARFDADRGRAQLLRTRETVHRGSRTSRTRRARCGRNLVGSLRVCAAVTFARLHVIPRLPLFLAEHPALDVEVLLSDANKNLVGAGIDVALLMGQPADSSLTARKIGQSQRRVIGSPAYFQRMGVPQTPADLAKHQAVVYDQGGGGTAWTFRRGDAKVSVIVDRRVRVSAAGRGWALRSPPTGCSRPSSNPAW